MSEGTYSEAIVRLDGFSHGYFPDIPIYDEISLTWTQRALVSHRLRRNTILGLESYDASFVAGDKPNKLTIKKAVNKHEESSQEVCPVTTSNVLCKLPWI